MNTSPQHPQEIIHIGNNNFSEPLPFRSKHDCPEIQTI